MAEKTEFEEIFGDEFFVIDSENLDEINGRLYGFSINDGILVENENYNNQQELTGEGAYVYISIDNDTISIFQDFMGSYGLYLFTKNVWLGFKFNASVMFLLFFSQSFTK